MEYKAYLERKGLVPESIITREKRIASWLKWLPKPVEKTNYKDLMNYISFLQNQGKVVSHINEVLVTISDYYDYKDLVNVAINTRLKGLRKVALNQAIKKAELEQIYQGFESSKLDKIIIGLMVYQGLEQGDFKTLEIKDINLEKGTIYIPSRHERRSRVLTLESHQILPLNGLINEEKTTNKLFSPYNDNPNHFSYILQKLSKKIKQEAKKKYQIKIVKLGHLRQSRIAIWVKTEGIRIGQYKAGFRRVMSAEKYQKADLENLREQINLHHPFK